MAFRPSGVSVFIRQDLVAGSSRSGTTLNIDPIITNDGTRITMTHIGDIGYAKIDPGKSTEEIISFTGITDNTDTYQLTGVVWGYSFHENTGGNVANQKKHVSGANLIITNDDHFLEEQYINKDDPTGADDYTPTTDENLTTKSYVDTREGFWTGAVADYDALPMGSVEGEARVTLDTGKIYVWDISTATGGTYSSVTANVITTAAAHGLSVGEYVYWETTDTLPTGLAVSTPYYVLTTPTTTTFTLSATKAGAELTVTTGSAAGTNTYKEASWVLAGASTGTVYRSTLLGTDADDAPTNTTFSLGSGSWALDINLQVYLNGVLMELGASEDYVTLDDNTIQFNTAVEDTDKVTLYVSGQ